MFWFLGLIFFLGLILMTPLGVMLATIVGIIVNIISPPKYRN